MINNIVGFEVEVIKLYCNQSETNYPCTAELTGEFRMGRNAGIPSGFTLLLKLGC